MVNNYDRAAIGNPRTPEIQFGIPLGLSYKGFDFSMLWQGSALCSVQLSGPAVWDFPLYDQSRIGKVRRMHLDRWTPETAATAKYPALHYGIHNNNKQQYSSLFLYEPAHVRQPGRRRHGSRDQERRRQLVPRTACHQHRP